MDELNGVTPTKVEFGNGAYGRVFEVKYDGKTWAAKEIHEVLLQHARGEDLRRIRENFLRECRIWSVLDHPCVVQFIGLWPYSEGY